MSVPPVTRIEPARRWSLLPVREMFAYRDLFVMLTQRGIKLRYRQTLIGVLWVVIQPLLTSGLFAIIFGALAGLPDDGAPYMLTVYAAMLPWGIVSQMIQRGSPSLVADRRLVSKIYFPRAIVPLGFLPAVLLDALIAFLAFFVLAAAFGHPLSARILLVPVLAIVPALFAAGLALLLSALNVYYRDVGHAVPFGLQFLLYLSPIAYSATLIPEQWQAVYALNPLTGIVASFRWAMLGTGEFPVLAVAFSLGVGAAIFLLGSIVFRRLEPGFADVI